MNQRELERAARDAHQAGTTWQDFWEAHGHHVRTLEPWHRGRFHALVQRLLGLLVSGDCDGQQPVGDVTPWERDDQQQPHDTRTQAHFNWGG